MTIQDNENEDVKRVETGLETGETVELHTARRGAGNASLCEDKRTGMPVLSLQGNFHTSVESDEVDTSCAVREIVEFTEAMNRRFLVFNLYGVRSISAVVVAYLEDFHRRLAERGCECVLVVNPIGPVTFESRLSLCQRQGSTREAVRFLYMSQWQAACA